MSWNSFIKPAAISVAAMLACVAAAAGANPLVVKSSGPSAAGYPPGKAIPNSAKISLRAGDTVVLLDGRGTRTLRGPGLFSPTIASTQLADTRELPARANGTRARIGAVRGMAGIAESTRNPNIWFVDVAHSAHVCITDPNGVTMWRGGARAAATMELRNAASGKAENVTWARNQSLASWPASMPVTDGARYTLSRGPGEEPTALTFTVLGPNPAGLEDTAALLIKNGCTAQLDLLIETVSVPGAAVSPAG